MDIQKLLNRITVRNYVNLHGGGNLFDVKHVIKQILDKQSESFCIAVDITKIKEKSEEGKVEQLKNTLNREMHKKGFPHWIHGVNSIDNLLHKFNGLLEDRALIIFHPFTSPKKKNEKDWLRPIRSFIQMRKSLFLKLLLISSDSLDKWDLRPSSDFDERAVEFFPYE